MCGFLAWFKIDSSKRMNPNLFKESLKVQEKRGPDSTNFVYGNDFSLGHNRLTILDNDDRSNQPFSKDQISFLLYNGEIYNLNKLRKLIKCRGIELITTSDTEILYELLVNFGIDESLKLIEGMFAFVFYNDITKEVIAAKDKFGQKPLFIFEDSKDLIFSSSLNSIKILKPMLQINIQVLKNYIYTQGHTIPSQTFFKNINSLNAGHYLKFNNKERNQHRYFNIESLVGNKYIDISETDAIKEASSILSCSVKEHLNADCKVGALVSGGIDSMLIHSFIKDNFENVTSFTKISKDIEKIPNLVLEKGLVDEDFLVRSINPTKKDYLSRLVDYIEFGGRPAPWGGGPPMMDLCRKARSLGFKVLLSGDCIDEFSAGYIPSMLSLENFSGNYEIPDHLCNMKYVVEESPFLDFQKSLRERIRSNMKMSENNLLNYFRLNACQNIEFHLQETNLPHSDTFSMFESIELRNPYLNTSFVEMMLNIDLDLIYNYWNNKSKTGKYLLKKIAQRKYGKNLDDQYYLNKEGTRNYSYFVSNKVYWNFANFSCLSILNGESFNFNDWKVIFNLVNLEIFIKIFSYGHSKDYLLNEILSDQGKYELLS